MSKEVASIHASVGVDTSKAQAGLSGFKGSLANTAQSIKSNLVGAMSLTAVIAAAGKAYEATAGETIKYANEVRNLSLISGESAQSTSRLIQVSDDYKVSTSDLMTAQRMLAKEGYSLNIETMAKLSDEYLKLNTGAERQQFLTENLGRSGAVFAEMMSMGSEAIKERSNSISASLILDQKALDDARRYEFALDDLNDQIYAMKISMGRPLVDFAADRMETVNQIAAIRDATGSWAATWNMIARGMELDAARMEVALKRLRKEAQGNYAVTGGGGSGASIAMTIDAQSEALRKQAYFWASVHQEQVSATGTWLDYSETIRKATDAETDWTQAVEFGLSYYAETNAYQQQRNALQEEFNQKWEQGYRNMSDTSVLGQLKQQMEDLDAAQASIRDKNTFDYLAKGLSGLEGKEQLVYKVAVAFGQMDEKAVLAYQKAQELSDYLKALPPNVDIKTIMRVVAYFKVFGNIMGSAYGGQQFTPGEYSNQGVSIGNENIGYGDIQSEARGGGARGLFAVGDAPGGGWTPYTEVVYAPGGAYVYNAGEARRRFGGMRLRGYPDGGRVLPMIDQAIGNQTSSSSSNIAATPITSGAGVGGLTSGWVSDTYRGDASTASAITQIATITAAVTESTTQQAVSPVIAAVMTSAAASQATSAQTAALADQMTSQNAQTVALLESINARLGDMPNQIRDGFQQVIQ